MCGIVGAMDLRGKRIFPADTLRTMCRAIAHRGPDSEGLFTEPGIALGVRRLAIVDLEGGRQPICNERGTVWVAFNGELFEYPELFRELAARGHRLATRCDTEIWVHLYEDHGEEMLDRARGQFAVALWDADARTLILARDRIGICPLYHATCDGWLLWASEIKGLLASGLVDPEPDPKGINNIFTLCAAGASRTAFAGVKSLAPGHYIKVRDGHVQLKQYWDLDFPDAGDELRVKDPRSLVDELESLLRQSVRRRLRGDVPVVTYLSGGIDSTLVTTMACQESSRPVPSFTVSLDGAGKDEGGEAAATAKLLGSRLTTVRMNRRDIADSYPDLITAAETPVVDTSCGCVLRMAAAVHEQGFRVALSGEGSDEILAGYPFFQFQKLQALTRLPVERLFHLTQGGILTNPSGGPRGHSRRRTPFYAIGSARATRQCMYELVSHSRERLFSVDMWRSLQGHNPYDDLQLTNDRLPKWHPLNQSLYLDFHGVLQGVLVSTKADRASMNSSVESRPPFLDEDIIAFCARLHPRYKLRGLREKWILRKVGERMLPRQIAWRRKWPFMSTFAMTFLGPQRPSWVDELLSTESLRATGYFDPDAVARERVRQVRGRWRPLPRISFDVGLTAVVATQLWRHIFCGGGLCDLPTWSVPK